MFEAGRGAGQHSWALVAPAVPERTGGRVVTYNRATPTGRHVQAEHSQHMVLLTEPALVVDEIVRACGRGRRPR